MVERAVRGTERPIGGSRGLLEDLGASQRVWKASQGVWRVKLGRGSGKTKKRRNVETVD